MIMIIISIIIIIIITMTPPLRGRVPGRGRRRPGRALEPAGIGRAVVAIVRFDIYIYI